MASSDNTTTAAPRLDRRTARTRKALMGAALELLPSRGYEAMTTDDITELAEVGRRTFYNHFVSKEDCVLAALKHRFASYADEFKQSLDIVPEGQQAGRYDPALMVAHMAPQMFLLIALDSLTETLIDYPRLLAEAVADSQRDHMVSNLANGLASGRFKPALPVEALEPILSSGFIGLVSASIQRKSQAEDSQAWARFVLMNLGISGQEAGELLEAAASAA